VNWRKDGQGGRLQDESLLLILKEEIAQKIDDGGFVGRREGGGGVCHAVRVRDLNNKRRRRGKVNP